MVKNALNLAIEGLLLVCVGAIAGIGFLIKYVLVPGYRSWEIYHRNVNLTFWGWDRHDWGTVHYILGWSFFVLLVLHILLQWRKMVTLCRKVLPNRWSRRMVVILFLLVTVVLLGFSFWVRPEVQERGRGPGGGLGRHEFWRDNK
ncbi:MAG: DUF4405 domain-containing protein [Phycisphaerae bacterium]